MPLERIQLPDKEVIILGTAHVSKSSVEETHSAIQEFKPDEVAVELCRSRFDVMKNPQAWQEMDIVKVIREKKSLLLFANLVMSSLQRRMGEKLDVKPGDEMRAAIEEAEAAGIEIALIDRPVQITLQRAWKSLGAWEKTKFLFSSLTSILSVEDIGEEEIEKLKEKDMLTQAVEEIAKQAPTIKRVLIDERDAYMARKIADLKGSRVLAVVGAGHMNGIIEQIRHPVEDISVLEEVPEKKIQHSRLAPSADSPFHGDCRLLFREPEAGVRDDQVVDHLQCIPGWARSNRSLVPSAHRPCGGCFGAHHYIESCTGCRLVCRIERGIHQEA